MPIYSMQLFDRVVSSSGIDTLISLSLIVAMAFIASGILTIARSSITSSIHNWIDSNIVPDLLRKAIIKSGGLTKVAMGNQLRNLNTIKSFFSNHVINFVFDAPWSLVFLTIVFLIHPYEGILALVGCAFVIVMGIIYEIFTVKDIEASEERFNDAIKISDESSRNSEVALSLGMTLSVIERWKKLYKDYMSANHKVAVKSNLILNFIKTIRYLLQIAVMAIGVYLVIKHEMTMGGVMACSVLVARVIAPFENSTIAWKSFVESRKAFSKLKELLEIESDDIALVELPEPKGRLSVKEVTYALTPFHVPIIKNVSFSLNEGDMLGIVGRNGSGKSTLLKMLVGALPPSNGEVRLDGASISYVLKQGFGKYIGYVPQNPQLFDKTIAENIARLSLSNIDGNQLIGITKLLNIHDMILKMPKGYETIIGTDGVVLSAGQRQALSIARSLYGNPKYVLMDEPSTNLDTEIEIGLLNALRYLKSKQVTCVIVSHAGWLLQEVNKVLVLDNGELKNFGTVEEVARKVSVSA